MYQIIHINATITNLMPFKRETSLDIFPVLHMVNPQKFLWAKLLSGQLLDLNEFLRMPTSQP